MTDFDGHTKLSDIPIGDFRERKLVRNPSKYVQIVVHLVGGQDIVLPYDVITLNQLVELMGTDKKAFFVDENLNKFNLIGRHIEVVIEVPDDEDPSDASDRDVHRN